MAENEWNAVSLGTAGVMIGACGTLVSVMEGAAASAWIGVGLSVVCLGITAGAVYAKKRGEKQEIRECTYESCRIR